MRPGRAWGWLLGGLAAAGAALIAGTFAAIVADVTMRAVGLQPPLWTGAFSEYALLYATMLAAPWLVRRDGHIRVSALTERLPAPAAAGVERLVWAIAAATAALLAWYAAEVGIEAWRRGELDYRSVVLPRWLLYAPIPASFALMAVEFLRRLAHAGASGEGAEEVRRSL